MKRNSQEGRCSGPRRAPCARMQQLGSGDVPQIQVIVVKMQRCKKGRTKLESFKSSPAPAVTGDAVNACCLFNELNSRLQCVCRFIKTADFLCEDKTNCRRFETEVYNCESLSHIFNLIIYLKIN